MSVTVVNALDNTVSVGLGCRGPAGSGAARATSPAGGQKDLAIAVGAVGKVIWVLEKAPEAVEEA